MDYGRQLYMSERDGKDRLENTLKKACPCWFARES